MVEKIYNRLKIQQDITPIPTIQPPRKPESYKAQAIEFKDKTNPIDFGEKPPNSKPSKTNFQDVKPIISNLLEKNNINFMNIRQINYNSIRFDLNSGESDDVRKKIKEFAEYIASKFGWKIDYHVL